jgi:hypothetical protein
MVSAPSKWGYVRELSRWKVKDILTLLIICSYYIGIWAGLACIFYYFNGSNWWIVPAVLLSCAEFEQKHTYKKGK